MPKYEITFPDGRTMTMEGTSPEDVEQRAMALPAGPIGLPARQPGAGSALGAMAKGMALPVAGTALGGLVGSFLPGPGTALGAGLGGVAGEAASQALGLSEPSALQLGLAAAPAALSGAVSLGRRVLPGVSAVKQGLQAERVGTRIREVVKQPGGAGARITQARQDLPGFTVDMPVENITQGLRVAAEHPAIVGGTALEASVHRLQTMISGSGPGARIAAGDVPALLDELSLIGTFTGRKGTLGGVAKQLYKGLTQDLIAHGGPAREAVEGFAALGGERVAADTAAAVASRVKSVLGGRLTKANVDSMIDFFSKESNIKRLPPAQRAEILEILRSEGLKLPSQVKGGHPFIAARAGGSAGALAGAGLGAAFFPGHPGIGAALGAPAGAAAAVGGMRGAEMLKDLMLRPGPQAYLRRQLTQPSPIGPTTAATLGQVGVTGLFQRPPEE